MSDWLAPATNFMGQHAPVVIALLIAYRGVDRAIRERLAEAMSRAVGKGRGLELAMWLVPLSIASLFVRWSDVPAGADLRIFSLVLTGGLTWKAATEDIDLGIGRARGLERLLAIVCVVGGAVSPALVVASLVVLTTSFNTWQHHATLPLRVLQVLVAFFAVVGLAVAAGLADLVGPAALLFTLVVLQASHYFVTGLAKSLLGRRWYSWMLGNRLHYIMGSAYSWGWARRIPWPMYRRAIDLVRRFEKPMQVAVFAVEFLAPLALLHPVAALSLSLVWAAFHLSVFLTSGLLFWEWVVADLAIAYLLWAAPAGSLAPAFGVHAVVVGTAIMFLLPLRHRLWKPMPLGWYDTPLTQRVHWHLHGQSGAVYAMYNDFMCPHERLYGRVHGCFFVPVPVFTYHLGEVWKPELRDAIVATGGDPAAVEAVRRQWGVDVRHDGMAALHTRYLQRVFCQLNRGARKSVLPDWLRWLKAPGGQYFHGGDLPAYRRQEPIVRIELVYREEFFDGDNIRRLRDEVVADIPIRDELDPKCEVLELATKQLDDMLLDRAKGRLIDLPSFGGGLTNGDDGRQVGRPLAPT